MSFLVCAGAVGFAALSFIAFPHMNLFFWKHFHASDVRDTGSSQTVIFRRRHVFSLFARGCRLWRNALRLTFARQSSAGNTLSGPVYAVVFRNGINSAERAQFVFVPHNCCGFSWHRSGVARLIYHF